MQTSQSAALSNARAGMIRGSEHEFHTEGGRVAEVAIAEGLFVCLGTDPAEQVKLPTSAAEVQSTGLGFARLDTSKGDNGTANLYAIGDAVPVVTWGPGFWAVAGEDLTVGDAVFVVFGATDRGKIRNDASSGGTEAARLHGARVERSATSGNPVFISLRNLPTPDIDT